ncbi:MAG: YceI family protein [Dysgonamonadaceae bacterium]
MKKLFSFIIALSSIALASAQTTWTNDPAHSRLGFTVRHLTISQISGYFADFNTTVVTSKADYSDAKISVTGKIASINTGVEARDNHLKTADFFDAEKYPTLTFTSTSFTKLPTKGAQQKAILKGNLTLHGITKPVVLNVVYYGTTTNPMNQNKTAGFHISGQIKRSDFGIGPKFPDAMVSDLVTLVIDAEFSPNK